MVELRALYIFFPKNRYKEKSLQSNETGKPQFQNTWSVLFQIQKKNSL